MDILGGLNFVLSVAIGLFILVFLVVIHELGHAIAARRNGVIVEEFGVGFPPRAWAKKLKNGVLFTLNWLPLGGFVKLQGEHDAADKSGDYGATSLWIKTKILLAGVVVNWGMAAIIFMILMWVGMPKLIANQFYIKGDTTIESHPLVIEKVTDGSPAAKAGLEAGDVIKSLQGKTDLADISVAGQITKSLAGQDMVLVYSRNSLEKQITVHLNDDVTAVQSGYLGVRFNQKQTIYRSTWSAPVSGFVLTAQLSAETFKGLGALVGNLFTGIVQKFSGDASVRAEANTKLNDAGNGVAGPIAVLGMLFPNARQQGIASLLLVTGIISLSLAIMNLLPIPALDGGRWFVTMLYRVVLRKPLSKEKEESIHGTGFMVLMGLVVVVTVLDIGKFLK